MKKINSATLLALILSASMAHAAGPDADGDGVPDAAEPLLHTDPMNADTDGDGQNDLADTAPVVAPDPFAQAGASAPYRIGEVLVENNVDPATHKDAPDHLEIQVFNDGNVNLSNLALYYTFTDAENGDTEAYILRPKVVIPAKGEARIHIDDGTLPDHLRANPNSIYVTSQAAKHVTVAIQADGFEVITATVEKDAGGAEAAD
ncbi:MAG: hypothetical protein K9G72_21375 [Rhodobacteraceae bacterium]|nr:hypothetical protein [Paracoccaceae bacterium]